MFKYKVVSSTAIVVIMVPIIIVGLELVIDGKIIRVNIDFCIMNYYNKVNNNTGGSRTTIAIDPAMFTISTGRSSFARIK